MRAAAVLFTLLLLTPAGSHAARRGAAVLEARALLVEGEAGPEVRVELQVRNVGSGTLEGCVGRSWGWRFPRSDDSAARAGARVTTAPRALGFALKPAKVFRWAEKLSYAGPKAWIEPVVFEIDLLSKSCKGKPIARLESAPVLLIDGADPR